MAAGYQDLYLEKGTTFSTQLTLTDSYGVPYDLSHFTVTSQARTSYASSNVAINFVVTTPNPLGGVVFLSANSQVTSSVVPNAVGKLVYDVLLVDDIQGNVTRVIEGQIFVSPSTTR